ncbi:rhomboid-like protein [Streptomyces tricolor]|uniref:rhomboid-like protein n=1 Tax=Streptomyces TaxID=1883 RepID=UPI001AD8101B|nr:rhomboid-like protein [Streptomyces sp. PBH53]
MRIVRGLSRVWAYVRGAPGTYVWLGVLCVTTVVLHHMPPEFEEHFLRRRSTNLHELSRDPVRALVASAMWIESGHWVPYAFLYTVFHAPAERWLGTARWLAVCALAHVVASLVSEGMLLEAIRRGRAPYAAVDTLDVGVSYALAGVIAVLAYRIAAPWRYAYLLAVTAVSGLPLAAGPTFTDVGHFLAVLLGLACYPLVRGRGKAWNPKETLAGLRG